LAENLYLAWLKILYLKEFLSWMLWFFVFSWICFWETWICNFY